MNDIMDMKISGSSAMPGGEYRTVSILSLIHISEPTRPY